MKQIDILVVGAGPAGMCAAVEAARVGSKVLLVEENPHLGGQLTKQTHNFFGSKQHFAGVRGIDIITKLEAGLNEFGVEVWLDSTATGYFPDGVVTILKGEELIKCQPEKIVVCSGAYENVLSFPNNDLPGVYGAGAVQTLMNVNGVLPGKKVLMIGAGNIGLIVSYQLMQAGAQVVAVVEAAPKPGGWDVHAAKIKRMGVPVLCGHSVKRVDGKERVESATIEKLDKNWLPIEGTQQTIEIDTVCLAVGLSPFSELLAQAGCPMVFSPALGGYVAKHDQNLRVSMPGFYVAGDVSGVEEASAAMCEGRIAGLTAALDLRTERGGDCPSTEELARMEEFQADLAALRTGPMGCKAREGKNELWANSYYTDDYKPNSPQAQEATWSGAKAIIECPQYIPCDPCVSSCPTGAISMDTSINDIPKIDIEKCTGCGICVGVCPGLAIFLQDRNFTEDKALLVVPYELYPYPAAGDKVYALNKSGEAVCEATVERVRSKGGKLDRRALVSFSFDKKFVDEVRHFSATKPAGMNVVVTESENDDDPIICRCEDVRRSAIVGEIRKGLHSMDELRRVLRVGMGPCQGKSCASITRRILAQELGGTPADYAPSRNRSPLKPVDLGTLAQEDADWELPLDKPHGGGH